MIVPDEGVNIEKSRGPSTEPWCTPMIADETVWCREIADVTAFISGKGDRHFGPHL